MTQDQLSASKLENCNENHWNDRRDELGVFN
jgi:hypothetical protein